MKKLWIMAVVAMLSVVPLSGVQAQENGRPHNEGSGPSYSGTYNPTYSGLHHQRKNKHRNSPIYNGTGFGPNYNPSGMSGLNANGNTGPGGAGGGNPSASRGTGNNR